MKPIFIPTYIKKFLNKNNQVVNQFTDIGLACKKNLLFAAPEVSIIIPAYNEEVNIVATLASLCNNKTTIPTEIIVVNNNSTDRTEELVVLCGIKCIKETKQGITEARNAGLNEALGGIILNADADTIYPKNWIQEMTKPLVENKEIAITYGRFSFIPTSKPGRVFYYFYEIMADFTRFYNNFKKDKAVNVYGFNSGFRRLQGIQVDGFNHPIGTNEDGYLALKLSERGFGKIHRVKNSRAIVWTTDRRIQIDGGIIKAIFKRLSRLIQ